MKKVCFVIPSLQSGGMERVMAELVKYFDKKEELEIHLILYGKSREIFYSIPDSVNIYKPDFTFNSKFRFYSTIKTLWYLRKQVCEIDPKVILSLGEYWNSFVLLALLGLKYPVYVSDRCKPDKHLGRLHEYLRKWLYPGATGIIAQTELAKKIYFRKSLNNNIKVIGNPIRDLKPGKQEYEKENIILTVGRLIKTKHHDRLIRIFRKIDNDNWKLVIVGGDALKQNGMARLSNLVEKYNMEDKIELTGTVSNIEAYYHRSKIFVFTSSSEGFPNVIGEAMSAGLPVISYDCVAGPSEMIDDGENGYLIPLFDDEQYLDKLNTMVNNQHLRKKMGEASRKKIDVYSVDNIAEKYYSFIIDSE